MARAPRQRTNGNGAVPPAAPSPHALDPDRQKVRIPRSLIADVVPTGLEVGELGANLVHPGAPRLWIGVPTSVDPLGRRLVSDSGAYLPLTGGTLYQSGNPAYNLSVEGDTY